MPTLTITVRVARSTGQTAAPWQVEVEHQEETGGSLVRTRESLHLDQSALLGLQLNPLGYGQALGRQLFDDVPAVGAFLYRRPADGPPLRVNLVIDDPALRHLHWERLCGPPHWQPLALDQQTPFTQAVASQSQRRFPPLRREALRLVLLVASPEKGMPYNLAAFDEAEAIQAVTSALGPIPVDLLATGPGAVGPPTLDALCAQLTAQPTTLLHLVCHGRVIDHAQSDGEIVKETVLYLGDPAHPEWVMPVPASTLITRLARLGNGPALPHLVVLASCQSADPAAATGLGSLAHRLVEELGVPAVVAMTGPVTVTTAHTLASAFYTRLQASSSLGVDTGGISQALVEATAWLASQPDIASIVPVLVSRLSGLPSAQPAGEKEHLRSPRNRRFGLELQYMDNDRLRLRATLDERVVAEASEVRLSAQVPRTYLDLLRSHLDVSLRLPGDRALDGGVVAGGLDPEPGGWLDETLIRIGRELGTVLYAEPVGSALTMAIDGLRPGEWLEFTYAAADPALLALPFEVARLPDGRLPALQPAVTVLRRPIGRPSPEWSPPAGPLKILVAVGAPDEGQTMGVSLDLEAELQAILDAVEPAHRTGNAAVTILEVSHPAEIGRALRSDAYHILHLAGHGAPGMIELDDEEGQAVVVTAAALAAEITAAGRPLPLVLLSACQGGVAASETVGLAQGLVAAGLPMVLAMQANMTDTYAIDFAGLLYQELATADRPLVSRALATTRRELERRRQAARASGATPGVPPEYATPTLFCTGPERSLLDPSLPRVALSQPARHTMSGPLPELTRGELVGRRRELRRLLRVLRDDPRSKADLGRRHGALLTGLGGVGKSALAGRAATHLAEQGWAVATATGRFDLAAIARAVGICLPETDRPALERIRRRLIDKDIEDNARREALTEILRTERLLLVLDNFEDNLVVGGGSYRDPTIEEMMADLMEHATVGKLLLTSRYPVPGSETDLVEISLGPLSPAETRKLVWRLPALRQQSITDLTTTLRRIGGHPRVLEFVDGLLRSGQARWPAVSRRLRQHARQLGIDLEEVPKALDETLPLALIIGARDILMGELLTLVEAAGDRSVLEQIAVSTLPVDTAGLAWMLAGAPADAAQKRVVRQALRRLGDLSLVTERPDGHVEVHRWTAEVVRDRADRADGATWPACSRRAGDYRWWQVQHEDGQLVAALEAVRNWLAGAAYDQAVDLALGVIQACERQHQTATIAAIATEVLETLPPEHPQFLAVVDAEGQALQVLGFTSRALDRYQSMLVTVSARVQAEPGRTDYQRHLSICYERLGDLLSALGQGEASRRHHEQALHIREHLAQAEPDRAEYQCDLSISYERLGDRLRALGQGEVARRYYEQARTIWELLIKQEPDQLEYQRGVMVTYNGLGDQLWASGQTDSARRYYEQTLNIAEHLDQLEPNRSDNQIKLSASYERLGEVHQDLGQFELARSYYERSQDIWKRLIEREPDRLDYQRGVTVIYNRLGDLLQVLGHREDAHRCYEQALAIAQRLAQAEPNRADRQRDLAILLIRMAEHVPDQSEVFLQHALERLSRLRVEGRTVEDVDSLIRYVEMSLGERG